MGYDARQLPRFGVVKLEKRVQIALPVKVSGWAETGKNVSQMACTHDISERGARLVGVTLANNPGDILVLERGKSKALYRVMWIGRAGTPLEGQIGVSCIEPDKMIWEVNLQELEEQYEPIIQGTEDALRMNTGNLPTRGDIVAKVGVYPENGETGIQGSLLKLSYLTCHLHSNESMTPQIPVNVLIVTDDVDIRLHGLVQRVEGHFRLQIALDEVRRGDRRKLKYLMETQVPAKVAKTSD